MSALVDKNINYINIIESGKSMPPISMIQKIANAIGVKPSASFEIDATAAVEQFTEKRKTAEDTAQEITSPHYAFCSKDCVSHNETCSFAIATVNITIKHP